MATIGALVVELEARTGESRRDLDGAARATPHTAGGMGSPAAPVSES